MISIALATYNGEKFIEQQLYSILNQSYQDFEVIICDDCSSDNTVSIIKKIKDNRFKLYQNTNNIGFRKNFEKIIENCNGKYIAFCDQDDVWLPSHLEILLKNINNNYYVGGNSILVNEELKELNVSMLDSLGVDIIPDKTNDWFKFLLFTNIFQGTASLVDTKFIKKLLPFPDKLQFHDYWIAINAAIYNKINYINKPVLLYRQHNNNITFNNTFNIKNRIHIFIKTRNNNKKNMEYLLNEINKDLLDENQLFCLNIAKKFWSNNFVKRISVLFWYIKNYKRIKGGKNFKIKVIRIIKYLINL